MRTTTSIAAAGMTAIAGLVIVLLAVVPARASDKLADIGLATATEAMTFRFAFGNVPLAEARFLLRERDGRYEMSGQGGTSGPLDWLFDWKGSVRTQGRLAGDALLPERHDQHGIWRGEARMAEIHYGPGPRISHSVSPERDPAEFTSVPEQSIPGTLDPLTAALTALKAFAETGICRGTLPIFDGRRRYDMLLEDAGPAVLKAERPWDYGGRAHGCRLKSRRIGGFFKDSDHNDESQETERLVWLAELAPGTWRPVRIEVDAPIGKFVGRAVIGGN